jgi:hypothetical protein
VTDRLLVCPSCGRASDDAGQRFCDACGMPLVPEGEAPPPPSEERERAMKVMPAYAEGPLVKVAYAHNQPEAELIAGLLLEQGVPCVVRRARGFDVPDFLAAGPRDVLVAQSGADVAADVLRAEPPWGAPGARAAAPLWVQAMAVTLVVVVVATVAAGIAVAIL